MSKRCPECHRINEDSRVFCTYCGATLDAELRLIQDLEKQKERSQTPAAKERGDVNFYVTHKAPPPKKSSPAPWIILGVAVIAVIAWFFLHG